PSRRIPCRWPGALDAATPFPPRDESRASSPLNQRRPLTSGANFSFFDEVAEQRRRIDWLLEPEIDARGAAFEVELLGPVSGHAVDSQSHIGRVAADLADHRGAVNAGQTHVEQEDIGQRMA